ncbi:MAG: creatininase family protein [Bacillota bacterium]
MLARRLLLLVVALLAATAPAAEERYIENLTSPELHKAIEGGDTTVLVPIGGTEQNGPHMALGKHNVRVRVLAGKIADALGNALVAPTVAYVPEGSIEPPTEHMRYPGTLSIPSAAFEQTLESAAKSLRHHGFRDIVFLSDHGSYLKSVHNVAARLNREWARTPARAHAIDEYYEAATQDFAAELEKRGFTKAQIGVHAGLADTSLTLAIDKALVRGEELAGAAKAPGVTGDPTKASAELGEIGVRLIVERTTQAIRKATDRRSP